MVRTLTILLCLIALNNNAQNWITPGSGVNDDIRSFYVDSVTDRLIALGKFTNAGGIPAKGIAAWDGNAWDSVSSYGVIASQEVWAVRRFNGDLYAIGAFWNSINDYYFARWNGVYWDSLQNLGLNIPGGLIEYNNELLCYGAFDTLGNSACSKIARWNGTQWLPFDSTRFGGHGIYTAYTYNGQLFVGGNFNNYSYSIQDIARWDVTSGSWQNVSGGVNGMFGQIGSIEAFNGELYIAGLFYSSDGNAGTCIQKWNGTQWSDVGGGMGGSLYPTVHKIKKIDNDLYAVGVFYEAGGIPAQSIAKWDGQNWCGLGSVFDNRIVDITVYHNEIYIAPGLIIDGDTIRKVAKWIGGNYIDTCGNTTGINENAAATITVSFYPNPANSSGTFRLNRNRDAVSVTVYDPAGRIIWKNESRENEILFPAGDFASGMYYYLVTVNGMKQVIGKFIIE